MIMREFVPMQERRDKKKSGEKKNANMRRPEAMPFFPGNHRCEKDYAVYV